MSYAVHALPVDGHDLHRAPRAPHRELPGEREECGRQGPAAHALQQAVQGGQRGVSALRLGIGEQAVPVEEGPVPLDEDGRLPFSDVRSALPPPLISPTSPVRRGVSPPGPPR